MPRGGAHGVDVAVVVEGCVPVAVVGPVAAAPLVVPPEVLVAPAPPAEDVELPAAGGAGGGAAGAGVTLGVGTGVDNET